jgi:polysaccharide biosynthesis/export protein
MHLQKRWSFGNSTIFILILLGIVGLAAFGQNASNTTGVAKPALPTNSTDAKTEQPPAADIPPAKVADIHPDSYVIGMEDVLTINVWKEPEVSRIVPVRPDGMISLPLVGEIKAIGLTPIQLQDQISNSLKRLMADPQVTVIISEVHSLSFNVVGQVVKPGFYPLTRRMTVLDAIALSGGFEPFAKQKKVYVLRTSANGSQVRLPFNYKNVVKGKNANQNIELQPRDTVVVP